MTTKADAHRAGQGINQKRRVIGAKYRNRIATKICKNYVGIARLRHGERPGCHRQQSHQSGVVSRYCVGYDPGAGWVVFHSSPPFTSFIQALLAPVASGTPDKSSSQFCMNCISNTTEVEPVSGSPVWQAACYSYP